MSVKLWAYRKFFIGGLETLARGLRQLPRNDLGLQGIATETDIPYRNTGNSDHTLDVYMPVKHPKPWPVAVYVHGGGFKFFDKDTHWAMSAMFARHGYLTFNVNYRLAPEHPYPAATDDVAAALAWIADNAKKYGGDIERLVYSGESAGGNLVLGAAISSCWKRPERSAQLIWNSGIVPRVLLPACGYLGVSEPGRHARDYEFPKWMEGRIQDVSNDYLPDHGTPSPAHDLANPLNIFEAAPAPDRPFPATFAIVGTDDPVRGDTIRLGKALKNKGIRGNHRLYDGGIHAFHAFTVSPLARRAWDDQLAFLDAHMPPPDCTN